MRVIKGYFTIIELVTASTLMLIMFMIIGFVFGSVSDITTKLEDKISEGIRVSNFFNQLTDDLEGAFPVFYLGDKSDGEYVNIASPGTTGADPRLSLPGGYITKVIDKTSNKYGASAEEFMRCVTTNHQDGGLLNFNGYESMNVNMNVDQNDKPVRYVTYNCVGIAEPVNGGFHARSVYRRDFPLRPDLRKKQSVRGGYSVGSYVYVGERGDGELVVSKPADGDINEVLMLEGVWEIKTEFLEATQSNVTKGGVKLFDGLGEKVLVKVTVEFAFQDSAFPHGNPLRFSRYAVADRQAHTYTTVIVVKRNNLDKN